MYLHKILNLPDKDPILQTYKEGLKFVYEKNWANDVRELREKYWIALTDLEVSALSTNEWKTLVTKKVRNYAFTELSKCASESSKIQSNVYETYNSQKYLSVLDAKSSRRLARIRSRTISCKRNHKESYKDMSCRAEGCVEEETQDHLLNCVKIHNTRELVSLSFTNTFDIHNDIAKLLEVMKRMDTVEKFKL